MKQNKHSKFKIESVIYAYCIKKNVYRKLFVIVLNRNKNNSFEMPHNCYIMKKS